MDFHDNLSALAQKVRSTREDIDTEEGTKNALIMPFLSQVLGYDVFNPDEVVPEYHADVGTKRGEKVDYAVMEDGAARLLIECKKIGEPLNIKHASQLFRYFSATRARIAVLTNGRIYQVYTDGDERNKMDESPFLVFDLLDIDNTLVPELQKLSKEAFDLDSVINSAEELKYIGMLKHVIADEVKDPSDDWLRFFMARVYEGNATQRALEQFRPLVSTAFSQFIDGQVDSRLKNAMSTDGGGAETAPPASDSPAPEETATGESSEEAATDEELEGFHIVRAIAASDVEPERIAYREAKSYFAIFLDDNNRKPVVRLHLRSKAAKHVTTFDESHRGTRHDVGSVVEVYKLKSRVREAIRQYDND